MIALLSDGISDFDGLYMAMATAARNVYDLANDPTFGSNAAPALPRSLVASYQTPVRLPGSAGASASSSSTQTRSSAPTSVAPAPAVVQPADKPRGAAPAAPAPRVSAPSGPAVAPAPAKPAIKPVAPSIFTMPTPTKTP